MLGNKGFASLAVALGLACAAGFGVNAGGQESQPLPSAGPPTVLQTTVRRVLVDVVVTDAEGKPVPGLTKDDFAVLEDGQRQRVLSFDRNGFGQGMDYLPPKLPPAPPNTFFNLPTEPEKGPLYVLLYDLVNMDNEDQMALTVNQHQDQITGRQQLMKFIQGKPEGSRFAVYVWSDGLHLIQGFTTDKAKLYAAIDPKHPMAHVPPVFLTGQNFGRGDPAATASIFRQLASDVSGLPGRKNVIWFSGEFPLTFATSNLDGPKYVQEIKATLDNLAQEQIALYPVDVRGVEMADVRSVSGIADDKEPVALGTQGPGSDAGEGNNSPEATGVASAARSSRQGGGGSLLHASYAQADLIAQETGGRAFYSNNNVAEELAKATEAGAAYYSLSYAPSNRTEDGGLRSIRVAVEGKGLRLAYRRAYYATPVPSGTTGYHPGKSKADANLLMTPMTTDALSANMHHGGPEAHGLLFAVQVHAAGGAEKATAEQMDELAKGWMVAGQNPGSASRPIKVQRYQLSYRVFGKQFAQDKGAPQLQLAAAAFDSDGQGLNAHVLDSSQKADAGSGGGAAEPAKIYRVDEEFVVPATAVYLRFAVRDAGTNRVGAEEIKLPLAPE